MDSGALTPHSDHTPHIGHASHVDHFAQHQHTPMSDNWDPEDPRWEQHDPFGHHDAFGADGMPQQRARVPVLVALLALILIFALLLGASIG